LIEIERVAEFNITSIQLQKTWLKQKKFKTDNRNFQSRVSNVLDISIFIVMLPPKVFLWSRSIAFEANYFDISLSLLLSLSLSPLLESPFLRSVKIMVVKVSIYRVCWAGFSATSYYDMLHSSTIASKTMFPLFFCIAVWWDTS
jgi:hypothetical protein